MHIVQIHACMHACMQKNGILYINVFGWGDLMAMETERLNTLMHK